MKKFISKLLHIIYPTKCICCGKFIDDTPFRVCDKCLKSIRYNSKYCHKCGDSMDTQFGSHFCADCRGEKCYFERVFVPLVYKDSIRSAIHNFKYRSRKSFAKTFAIFIFTHLKSNNFIPDIVTCVPIHRKRLLKRGYNQTEVLGKELATMLNVPFMPIFKKTHYTKPLAKLSAKERSKTVKNSFRLINNLPDIENKNILIVDDIITTSATLSECSKVIKKEYDCNVYAAAIASSNKYKK